MNKNSYDERFSISLHLKHPVRDLGNDCRRIGWEPSVLWKAGDQRRTPDGKILEGFRRNSYCSIKLETTNAETLAEYIKYSIASLQEYKFFLRKITLSGGSASLFIGWFMSRDGGESLDWETMKKLSELRLSLEINTYISKLNIDSLKS